MLTNNHESIKKFDLQKRRGLIVWVYSLKQLKQIKRHGFVHYVSKKSKYIVLYVNEENVETVIEKLDRLHFVRAVEKSYRPDIEMNFADKIGKKMNYEPKEDEGFEVEEVSTKIRLAENI